MKSLNSLNSFQRNDVKRPNTPEQGSIVIKDGFLDLNAIFSLFHMGDQMGDRNQIMDTNSISFSYFLKVVPTTYEVQNSLLSSFTFLYMFEPH